MIRTWHAGLLSGSRPSLSTAAKSYRLLRSILATAVDDEVLEKNPCRIRGAGVEHPKERPIANIEQVYALADAIEPRYRALVLTATFKLPSNRTCRRSTMKSSHGALNCSPNPCSAELMTAPIHHATIALTRPFARGFESHGLVRGGRRGDVRAHHEYPTEATMDSARGARVAISRRH